MASKFGPAIRELRIHLCQKSTASKGVRDWIEKQYVPLKKSNPGFPILIRECSNVTPKVYARYALGKENSVVVTNKSAEEVGIVIQSLAKA